MASFFINTVTGQVATQAQLAAEGVSDPIEGPQRPWFRIQGGSDAQMLWYAVMRRHTRGVFFGALTFRGSDYHASLVSQGWEEVPAADIGIGEHRGPAPGANESFWGR